MSLKGKLVKLEKEKRKLFKDLKQILEDANELEFLDFIHANDFSKFYKKVNEKYLCRSYEWDERMKVCGYYQDVLKKIENTKELQVYLYKKNIDNEDGYQLGQILYSSWGYEQTNVDFYQVIATSKKAIWLAAIGADIKATGWEQGVKSPFKNSFVLGKKVFKTLSKSPRYKSDRYLHKYEGKAVAFTSYY